MIQGPVRRPLHSQAADFAQSVVELQQDRERLEAGLTEAKAMLVTERAETTALRAQLEDAQSRLDYYHRRVVEIETKFDIAAKIVLDVLQSSPIRPEDKREIPQLTEGSEAFAKVLAEVATEPKETK